MNTKTLNECFFQIRNGANIKQGVIEGGFPITRIETIANGVFNRDRMGYAGINELDKYKDYVLEDGDLLMSHINSEKYLGRTVIYKKQDNEIIIHGMNLLGLKANRSIIIPDYAKYFFYSNFFRGQIANITKKSVNQASFSISDLKRLYILVPTLNQQHRIVAILDQVNDLISLRNQQLEQLDLLIKSRFVEMFGDLETNSRHWTIMTFKEFAIIDGKMTTDFEKYANYPHIGIDSIEKETGELKGYRTIKEDNVISGKYLFTPEHIIYSKIRPNLNKVALPKFEGLCSADSYPILPIKDRCNRVFLAYNMRSKYFLDYILKFCKRTNMPKVNREQLSSFNSPIPPLELQTQFAAFVEEVEKEKATVKQSLEELGVLKNKLMQDYFG